MLSNLFHRRPLISGEYHIIDSPDIPKLRREYSQTWQDPKIPRQQRQLTEQQLKDPKNILPYQVAVSLLKKIYTPKMTVLEIGCSSGYYNEVFRRAKLDINYEGCDYSPSFIAMAKLKYPLVEFKVSDATKLDYKKNDFDLAISGCCILHIIDYQKAISEAARVSKKYVIFHRTPVTHIQKTTFLTKIGYGTKMLEIHFNENELMNLFEKYKLNVKTALTFSTFSYPGSNEPVFMKSYLCQKQ